MAPNPNILYVKTSISELDYHFINIKVVKHLY